MRNQEMRIDVIKTECSSEEITREINEGIVALLQESEEEETRLTTLALECSAALLNADAMRENLSEQGIFRRFWNEITGKNANLRNAIDRDRTTAMYAMQETVNSILQESQRNAELALRLHEKMEGQLLSLEKSQLEQERGISEVRTALVQAWGRFEDYMRRLDGLETQLNSRCERCQAKIRREQIVCPVCGTIQEAKIDAFPPDVQQQFLELSKIVGVSPGDRATDILWCKVARDYAGRMMTVRDIAQSCGLLDEYDQLKKDMDELIERCRNPEFQIAVAGVLNAGKSRLLNALIGMELAPVDINSATAALAKFRSSLDGHYVKVRFHSQEEWDALVKSAKAADAKNRRAKTNAAARNRNGREDTTFIDKLKSPEVKKLSKKWVNHPPLEQRFRRDELQEFQDFIRRWTAAKSDEHLFSAEVEVGIDHHDFDMPPEVVFVDTPGLEDMIRYRSEITRKYIHRADAVLFAVKPDAMSREPYETLGEALDNAGKNQNKVLIVGTQKDKLQNNGEYDALIYGAGGWIDRLVQSERYQDKRAASRQIFTTSAYLHLCAQKAMRLSEQDFDNQRLFSDNEYTDLEKWIVKSCRLGRAGRYNPFNLRYDKTTADRILADFGIETLKKALHERLISNYRAEMIRHIAAAYQDCRERLKTLLSDALASRNQAVEAAQGGKEKVKEELKRVEYKRKQLEEVSKGHRQIMDALDRFTRELTDKI